MDEKSERIKRIVERELSCSAHNMDHVLRVYKMCLHLAQAEKNVDIEIIKAAALLHDIARVKEDKDKTGRTDHAVLSAEMAEKILKKMKYPEEKIKKIKHCILAHRFRSETKPETKEARILFDADKLDVLGAIGVARSFIMAGQYGERIYADVDIEEYMKKNIVGGKPDGRIKNISMHAPNIEFELKFKRIPKVLHTKKAKEIAKERMRFMNEFFRRMKLESEGKL